MILALESLPECTEPASGESPSIADLFQAASHELAASDARLYRSLDRHLKRTRELLDRENDRPGSLKLSSKDNCVTSVMPSYERQTRRSLQDLCRRHGVKGYSKMKKKDMIQCLVEKGIDVPQVPLEALSKAELIDALRSILQQQGNA